MELAKNTMMEEQVIGFLIRHPEMLDEARGMLSEDSFADSRCNTLYKAMCYVADKQNAVPDIVYLTSMFDQLGRGEDSQNALAFHSNCATDNITQCIEVLESFRKKRVLQNLGMRLMGAGDMDEVEGRELLDAAINDYEVNSASNIIDKVGLMQHACNVINENLDRNKPNKQILTGLDILDKQGGLPPATEVVIAAFSSQGKSTMCFTIINNAMKNGVKCALYSMEMGTSSIVARFLNMMGWGVSTTRFKTCELQEATIRDFERLAKEFVNRSGDLYLDEKSNNNADKICASIRVLHRTKGVQLVMIDYLQIIPVYDSSGSSDQEQLAKISRKFQAVAKELDICSIVLSQFSRPTKGQSHEPSEDLIRGSGQIFEACDIALYIYRPFVWKESYPSPYSDADTDGTAYLKIGKYRDGIVGDTCICGFDANRTLFYDFEVGKYDQDPKRNYPKAAMLQTSNSYESTINPIK